MEAAHPPKAPEQEYTSDQAAQRYAHEQARLRERLLNPDEVGNTTAAIGSSAVEASRQDPTDESEEMRPHNAFQRLAALRTDDRKKRQERKLSDLIKQAEWRDEFFGNGLEGKDYDDGQHSPAPYKTKTTRIRRMASLTKSVIAGELDHTAANEAWSEARSVQETKPDRAKKKLTKEIDRAGSKLDKPSARLQKRLSGSLNKHQPREPQYPRPTTQRIGSHELENSLKIAADKVKEEVQKAKDNPNPEPEEKAEKQR